jgi:hypothetical protein
MNQAELQLLSSRPEKTNNSVLTLYLNVDQSQAANRNRGFEKQLKSLMTELGKSIRDPLESERFRKAEHLIVSFVKACQIGARTIFVVVDEADGVLWHEELQIPMASQARWNREPLLQPLAAALDETGFYAVALIGHASFRLFVVSLDGIEELVEETFPHRDVRHLRAVGPIASGSHVQRKADERVRENLRHVAEDIAWVLESREFSGLVLAGTPQSTAGLFRLLPNDVAARVMGEVDLSINSSIEGVLAAAQPVAEKYERDSEVRLVDSVVTQAAKMGEAITGLGYTLKAVNQARVWQLIYTDTFHCAGFECPNCTALFSVQRRLCLYCGAFLVPVTDVVERAVEQALRNGAKIEVVKGEASARLSDVGGIGAFLKTRTGTIQM